MEYAERIALSAASFQKDMFLSFCLQNVPVCQTENTACSQKQREEAVNLVSGGGMQSGLLALTGTAEAFGNRKGHFSALEQSCSLLLEELDEKGVSCSPPTKQTRDKPLCSMHVKTFSSEIWSMLWQSVSFIINTMFRKMESFRLPNYCFKLSSYTIEEDNTGFICTWEATVPMFYVLVVRKQ